MISLGVVQAVQLVELEAQLGAVDKAAAVALRNSAVFFPQLKALGIGIRTEAEAEDHLPDARVGGMRRDQKHLGRGIGVVRGLTGLYQMLHAEGDHARSEIEHMLEFVAAHLENHQIQGRVCIQRHLQAFQLLHLHLIRS